jgi:oleate hydratase
MHLNYENKMTSKNSHHGHAQNGYNSHDVHKRDPESIHAWIVGGGIASLAAAVFLINDAKLPPSHVHIFDLHLLPGGGIGVSGDPSTGYVLSEGQQLSFQDSCIEKLLSLVPTGPHTEGTLWSEIQSLHHKQKHHEHPVNHLFVEGERGPIPLKAKGLGLDIRGRLELVRVMLESEEVLGDKTIADVFHPDFFSTKFWMTWSTT